MPLGDTIVARASAPGAGRRAIVRLSGPHCAAALHELGIEVEQARSARTVLLRVPLTGFPGCADASSQTTSKARPHRPEQGSIAHIPLLLFSSPHPRSYTGESSAELHLTNCPPLIESIIERLCAVEGVRRAEPGEFTARAFLSGRLTLAQAEGVAAKISADSARQLEAADRLLEGQAGDDYRAWSDEIASLLALVEAGIDFVDQEDVTPITASQLGDRLAALIATIEPQLGSSPALDRGVQRPLVVLVGPPNAGKSTLFNSLLGRRRAVASPVGGTTRDAIIEPLDLRDVGGPCVDLADLPGLEAAPQSPLDRSIHQRAIDVIARADVLVACDPAGRFEHLPPATSPTIRVLTKSDEHLGAPGAGVCVCALDGWHLPTLRRAIVDHCISVRRDDDAMLIPRHRQITSGCLVCLREAAALAATQPGSVLREPEFIALRLREALDLLGELAGAISPDAIIGRIFATFCIGK